MKIPFLAVKKPNAFQECFAIGGYIIEIGSVEENLFVTEFMGSGSKGRSESHLRIPLKMLLRK